MPDSYVWFIWSSSFLLPWVVLYFRLPAQRGVMWRASLLTMPFGLTEPLFVPAYWTPPSLFDLASRTGFDIESLIFCFAIGGIGVVLYNAFVGAGTMPMSMGERHDRRHRYHRQMLAVPLVVFPLLYPLPWNPIYPGIVAMFAGAFATMWCRPDLVGKSWIGGLLFTGLYVILLSALELSASGYIERVWNLSALSGLVLFHLPVEELLFAFSFGMYWSSVYEHLTWRHVGFASGDHHVHAG